MADDDAVERRENARLAAEVKMRQIALEIAREDRFGLWDQLGYPIRDANGVERLRLLLALPREIGVDPARPEQVETMRAVYRWAAAAWAASVTRNTRVLGWLVTLVSTTVGLLGIVKFYLDWRH